MSHGKSKVRRETTPGAKEQQLNLLNRQIAESIKPKLPEGAGYALLVFDLGEGGYMTWSSNARRQDMVRALREMADRLEAET